jgi:hypothetical protein
MAEEHSSISSGEDDELNSGGYEIYQSRISLPSNGGEYTGTLTEMGDKPHGMGILINDFMRYSGKFKLGRKDGLGRAEFDEPLSRYSNAQLCAAFWKAGMMSGPAVLKDFDENLFEGYMELNVFHGKGRMRYSNGDIYEGDWAHGKHDGFGIMKYKEQKEVYIGMWKHGEYEGHGIYKFNDGAVYDGMWKNNMFDGMGMFLEPKDDQVVLNFSNNSKDEKSGCGVQINQNFCIFGSFEKDEKVSDGGIIKFSENNCESFSIASRKEATEKWSLEQNSASDNVTLSDCLKTLLKSKQQEITNSLKTFKIRELEFQVFKQVRDVFFADRDSVEAEVDALGKEFKVDDCEFSAGEDVRSDDGSDEGSDLEGFIISDEENEAIEEVEFNPENENEGFESLNEDEYQLPSPSPSPLKKKSSSQKFKRSTIIIDDSEDDNHDDVKVIGDEERESHSWQKKSIAPVSPPKRSEALTSISAEIESEEESSDSEENSGFAEIAQDDLKMRSLTEEDHSQSPRKRKRKKKRKHSKKKRDEKNKKKKKHEKLSKEKDGQ